MPIQLDHRTLKPITRKHFKRVPAKIGFLDPEVSDNEDQCLSDRSHCSSSDKETPATNVMSKSSLKSKPTVENRGKQPLKQSTLTSCVPTPKRIDLITQRKPDIPKTWRKKKKLK